MSKILIVDDDHDIIDSLTMILEGNGYEVVAETDTDDIVAKAKEHNPDLIILDIIFPDDDQAGFKAARLLHADEQARVIPVLMLSAVNQRSALGFSFSERDISEDFMPVGGFIEKPVEPDELLGRIKGLLLGGE